MRGRTTISVPRPDLEMVSEVQLEEAMSLMRAGRLGEAETQLQARLDTHPDDARALRLLGTLFHLGGRAPRAIALLERALALEPDNISTLLNLGTVHLEQQRDERAAECFLRVVDLDPDSPDGHFNLGLAAQRAGRLQEAEGHYVRTLERDPGALDTLVNLATVHLRRRNNDDCLARIRQVLEQDPSHGQAYIIQLEALIRLGRLGEAEQILLQAPEGLAGNSRFHRLEGNLRFRTGRFPDAVRAYREALALGDTRMDTALDLGRCLLEAGQDTAAVESLRDTAERFPQQVECHALLGLALYRAGLLEDALQALDAAIALAPEHVEHRTLRARVLFELQREQDADAAVAEIICDAPAVATPHLLRMEQRLASGDLAGALGACEEYLDGHGLEWNLLAARAFLLHALGQPDRAAQLLDYDRLLSAWTVDPPEGYDSLASFNQALAKHVREHPSLSREGAASRATQHGRQSGNLLFGKRGPMADFESLLWGAAERYMMALPRDPGHPYLAGSPPLDSVYSWGVVLQRSGHQAPHIHPTAWLSGVYYAELPEVVHRGGSPQGWIEFGAPPPELALTPRAPTRMVQPREGLIVLFPSYFYHRTVPYDGDGDRISIAFDFSPVRRAEHRS